ncbi:MAG: hypothetical protein JJ864_12715 [Rhizobiaceae bacterium]|nr:hypothetical protein [Rhizobiaceae bacterium]
MKKCDAVRDAGARALAVQEIVTALLRRIQGLDPALRILTAQAFEDAASSLEARATVEKDIDKRGIYLKAVDDVEECHERALTYRGLNA